MKNEEALVLKPGELTPLNVSFFVEKEKIEEDGLEINNVLEKVVNFLRNNGEGAIVKIFISTILSNDDVRKNCKDFLETLRVEDELFEVEVNYVKSGVFEVEIKINIETKKFFAI